MTLGVETSSTAAATCAHCGQPVPGGLIDAGAAAQFCCAGCRVVYETLHACGLEAYYRLRDDEAPGTPAKPSDKPFEEFDAPTFHGLYVQTRADGLATADLTLENVNCAACVWLVERLPRVLDGVVEARLSLRGATVRVTWDPARVPLSRVARALDRLGYVPHPSRDGCNQAMHRRETRRRMIALGIAGAITGNAMLLGFALYSGDAGHIDPIYRTFFRWLSAALGLAALAGPGATFFRGAWAALRAKAINFDVPISLALLGGGVAGLVNVILGRGDDYFDSLSALVFLLLVGRFIQYRQQRRADDAVGLLFNLTPTTCHVVRGGDVIDAPVEALQVDEIVEVRPGELFPADGTVESGRSSVNAALLTGESAPVPVAPGAAVCAGSQNVASPIRVRVRTVGRDTRVGKLMALVERGVQEKPPIVQFADRVGAWFAVVVPVAALGVFAGWARVGLAPAIDHAVALLIVTCPCVLGISTPLTLAIAIGQLARRDVLVKSAAALERLSAGGRMILDKTGTLTDGKLELLRWTDGAVPKGVNLRALVGEIERVSNHPVGRALHEALGCEELSAFGRAKIANVTEKGDGGVSATFGPHLVDVGCPRFVERHGATIGSAWQASVTDIERAGLTPVVVAIDGLTVAVAALGDGVRADAADAIWNLRTAGWQPSILSGDAQPVVSSVARAVGIAARDAKGGATPEQKLAAVRHRADEPCTVMVGDGMNDAAALAAADVGIAVHGGAEASLSAADVYVARPGLAPLVDLVTTSHRAMRIVRRNLLVSLAYNLLAGTLAATGHMSPLWAAVIMPVSSATVLSLAAALMRRRRGKGGPSWK